MTAMIEINGLRKVYRVGEEKVVALDSIDLTVEKGELCCPFGTSGSGKSTLLNMIAGLEKPSRGEVLIGGKHVEKMSEAQLALFRQKYMGFIFQAYYLLPNLTALENVCLPLTFRGVSRKKREAAGKKALEDVGLKKYIRHRPTEMSGGQQQRVGIARAFVAGPRLILADEPTGNLDSTTTFEVMDQITKMAREHEQTLIIVTHDSEIADYADRIIHLRDGRIEKDERRKRPESEGERQQNDGEEN